MTRTLHRNFTEVTDAESARTALLAKGFPPASVTLTRHKPLPQNGATSTVSHLLDNLTPGGPDAAANGPLLARCRRASIIRTRWPGGADHGDGIRTAEDLSRTSEQGADA